MTIRKTTAMIAAITMLTVGACAKKAPDTLPPAPDGSGTDTGAGTGTGVVPGSQEDFLASVGAMGDRIFFDLDQYNVDAQDQTTLQTQAQWLARYPAVRVTLEGHADERGTREYNLALGQRRSESVKQAMRVLGVPEAQVEAVSFGKEKPRATGSTAADYAENRRADVVYDGE